MDTDSQHCPAIFRVYSRAHRQSRIELVPAGRADNLWRVFPCPELEAAPQAGEVLAGPALIRYDLYLNVLLCPDLE